MAGYQGGMGHTAGISVYGSGYAVGPKLLESFVGMPGADGYQRFDGGKIGISGMLLQAMSTRLSTVVFAMAMPTMPATGLAAVVSGFVSEVRVSWSSNCIDLNMLTNVSGGAGVNGGLTSSGTSSQIAWLAIGQ